ncbi:hypothetical protein [Sorangium sp. So ce131]|uniref:hypothetical protein n=1 Tax=Sorangium sp. So ce131 TaxID=3133282 RepID=UPI003F6411E3
MISMKKSKLSRAVGIAPPGGILRRTGSATRAWVAQAPLDVDGRRATTPSRAKAVIFAVSVSSDVPPTTTARIDLMSHVAQTMRGRVGRGVSSLWVFPGGYFGFDPRRKVWLGLRDSDVQQIECEIRRAAMEFPRASVVAVGVDYLDWQQVWILEDSSGQVQIRQITREVTSLDQRIFSVGQFRAAAFVCGEFTGSRTRRNGPFFIDAAGHPHYLDEPDRQLRNCHILIDLAHQRVAGTVNAPPNRRMVQQRQMERFSRHGVAVLTHHHDGRQSSGRAHSKHQSNWVVFPEGDWLSGADVVEIQ